MPASDKCINNASLTEHAKQFNRTSLAELFAADPERGRRFSLEASDIFVDYSKNHLTDETLKLLLAQANKLDLKNAINALFKGEKINVTEQRAALHTALRSRPDEALYYDNVDIIPLVHNELARLKTFCDAIHAAKKSGWTGKPLTHFVNIGIGGSDLGPKLVVDALKDYRQGKTRSYFISNIDYQQIKDLKTDIDLEATLFIVSSKSFGTTETLMNANALKNWLLEAGCEEPTRHFVAVTANQAAAKKFGVADDAIFNLWDWVGGRFSLWSAIGLPIALALGDKHFKALLAGAQEMDAHFRTTPFEKNVPVVLALIDYWYSNYLGSETHAFIPYDEALCLLPDYLAQLFMESNGKSTDLNGDAIDGKTMPIIWGANGTNAQHAFFQLLHQGNHRVAIDFLAPLHKSGNKQHHQMLFSNCLAQSQALMQGEANTDHHRHFNGNRPSTTLLYPRLTPRVLGAILALYEHRTFVQSMLWQINAFDQWGVELGKKLANNIYQQLNDTAAETLLDSSTTNLIERYKKQSRE